MSRTPGPWHYDPYRVAVTANGGREFVCQPFTDAKQDEENLALIAAAPDLLEALRPFVNYLKRMRQAGHVQEQAFIAVIQDSQYGNVSISVRDLIVAEEAFAKVEGVTTEKAER